MHRGLVRAEALCQLRGLRLAFVGDSLLRNLFENFAVLLGDGVAIQQLDPESLRGKRKKTKWGDFCMAGRATGTAQLLFQWAPTVPAPSDPITAQIAPRLHNHTLAGLFAWRAPPPSRGGPARRGSTWKSSCEELCPFTAAEAEGGPALADPLGGAERARAGPESWLTFCAPPGSASAMGESALLL
jgi:hypothetical protein